MDADTPTVRESPECEHRLCDGCREPGCCCTCHLPDDDDQERMQ